MSARDTGGCAFPMLLHSHGDGDGGLRHQSDGGMSLRDYFAARAMQSLVSNQKISSRGDLARLSYLMADAMIAERAKP